jgi:hypothetical protein
VKNDTTKQLHAKMQTGKRTAAVAKRAPLATLRARAKMADAAVLPTFRKSAKTTIQAR